MFASIRIRVATGIGAITFVKYMATAMRSPLICEAKTSFSTASQYTPSPSTGKQSTHDDITPEKTAAIERMIVDFPKNNWAWNVGSVGIIFTVGMACKLFLKWCTTTTLYGHEAFFDILMDPNRKRPLVTVSNHTSVLDDPLLWGILPCRAFWNLHHMRWTLGAQDICFTNPIFSTFFALGQTIPTIRGNGILQPAMNFALEKLGEGKWVHIYPEGKVNQTLERIRYKWGVGRLIMESEIPPIVIPMWHEGMDQVKPLGKLLPRLFKPVTVAFGDPIDFEDLLDEYRQGKLDEMTTRIRVTSRIMEVMDVLASKIQETIRQQA
ncbi:uncharacterized protein VTP21DRAFT_7547 [Calcarisporiella thermophila]|uniref:uncharacterized protein n=1 Tax=Calcarisporiella thermophila TaxID=911321 RepID=UPI0037441584